MTSSIFDCRPFFYLVSNLHEGRVFELGPLLLKPLLFVEMARYEDVSEPPEASLLLKFGEDGTGGLKLLEP